MKKILFKIKSFIFIALGIVFLILSLIGVIMPVLPTVPFLILTTIFFNLGSEKFKNWFTETKLYKNQVEKYIEHKSMSIKSELLLLSSVSIFLILILLIFGFKIKILQIIIPILLFAKYTYFIISINPISSTKFKKLSGGEK